MVFDLGMAALDDPKRWTSTRRLGREVVMSPSRHPIRSQPDAIRPH
ncbi:MAG: hypothetical protein AAFP13_09700 [Pseudomonadota bacterium]